MIGLAEYGWVCTLNVLDVDKIIFEDFVECGNRLATYLREKMGCNYIIALTHMRVPNDKRLCRESIGVDLILGGHDHVFMAIQKRGTIMIKSGSDYNELSEIKITKCDKPYVHYHTRKSPKKPKLDLGNPREDKVKRPIPPYVTDENSQPDVPYEYMTKNLNKGVKGSYEVTVIKREITTAIPPNPEIKEFVGDFEIKMNE